MGAAFGEKRSEADNLALLRVDQLHDRKAEIEGTFGAALAWERLDAKQACRIKHIIERGGYRSPEALWPEIRSDMVGTMTRLESAFRSPLESLGL